MLLDLSSLPCVLQCNVLWKMLSLFTCWHCKYWVQGGWNFRLKIMLNKIKQVPKLKTKFPMISVKLIIVAQWHNEPLVSTCYPSYLLQSYNSSQDKQHKCSLSHLYQTDIFIYLNAAKSQTLMNQYQILKPAKAENTIRNMDNSNTTCFLVMGWF